MAVDETENQDHTIRTSQTELLTLRQELDTVTKIKDSAIQENRRLQDELSSVTCDCRDSRKELDLYKRQVEDLKTQLQHYVAEVKRTEDQISNKEIERSELLDQFRSLSHEANVLETNNHTLENEATQSRVQLSVALDHAGDLERKLENKDSIIQSYEKQIGELTSQIASLEIQLRQCLTQYERANAELDNMRDMSHKLENENGRFRRQIRDRDDQRVQIDRNVDQLRSEREMLQHTVTRDRRNVESVEKDLHEAKHETTELRTLNQDLQEEVHKLKHDIHELKEKLIKCPCDEKSSLPPPYSDLKLAQRIRSSKNQLETKTTSAEKLTEENRMVVPVQLTEQTLFKNNESEPRSNMSILSNKLVDREVTKSSLGQLGQNKNDQPSTSKNVEKNADSNMACFCLKVKKIHLERRRLSAMQAQDSPNEEVIANCINTTCCPCPVPSVVSTCDCQKEGIKKCFTFCGPEMKSYIANYTLVHETHRADLPNSNLKK